MVSRRDGNPAAPAIRVVHVASGREWRGGQRQVLLLCRGLATQAEVSTLVVTGGEGRLARELAAAGVAVLGPRWQVGLDPRALVALLRHCDAGAIIHAHDGHAHAMADAVAAIRGARVVVTRRVATTITSPRRFRRAAAVISLSGAIAAEVARAGVPRERIHRIPPAVDLDSLTPPPVWPSEIACPESGRPLVVTIAALTTEKGVDLLLEAAALLRPAWPTLGWLVLGDGPERERLIARRRVLGLDDVVAMPGHVPRPEGALTRATVAVQPSRQEGFGSVVLEALALGVPMIASAVGGLPEALAAGGGVLVPPESPAALAKAVAELLADPARRAALADRGRVAAGGFAVGRLVQRTLEVYRSLDLHHDG